MLCRAATQARLQYCCATLYREANNLHTLLQVIMMFASPFWPEGFFDVVCTDSFIPEFWVTSPPLPIHYQPASPEVSGRNAFKPQHAEHAQQSQNAQQTQPSSTPKSLYDAANPQQAQHAKQEQDAQHAQQRPHAQQAQHAQHTQQQPIKPPVYCMVGFVAGSRAEEISKLRQNSVIIQTLSQLDKMFGKVHSFWTCFA